jgi:TPR repeat protein
MRRQHFLATVTTCAIVMFAAFADGETTTETDALAVQIVLKKAINGDVDAQRELGNWYLNGLGVPKNYEEAMKWYRKAAAQGDVVAQDWLKQPEPVISPNGNNLNNHPSNLPPAKPNNATTDIKALWESASNGDAKAQCKLGFCYYHGRGVSKNYKEAVDWFRKAAAQGDAVGQDWLGYCYDHAIGVPKDREEAITWYLKSAAQGYANAQNNLGDLYYYCGEGAGRDTAKAVMWYRMAAEKGFADAQINLAGCYLCGEGVHRDRESAVNWYQKAAAQGSTCAQDCLRTMKTDVSSEQERNGSKTLPANQSQAKSAVDYNAIDAKLAAMNSHPTTQADPTDALYEKYKNVTPTAKPTSIIDSTWQAAQRSPSLADTPLSDEDFNKTLPPLENAQQPALSFLNKPVSQEVFSWLLAVLAGSVMVLFIWKGLRRMEKWSAARKRKLVLCVALTFIVLAGLFPPWFQYYPKTGYSENKGMHFLLIPPENGSLNTRILFVEWLLIAIPATGLWFTFKDKDEGAK